MFVKVSPNHPSKLADRVAGAIVDQAYIIKKRPRVNTFVYYDGKSVCDVRVWSNFVLDKSIVDGIVKRIIGDNVEVNFEHCLVDNYDSCAPCDEAEIEISYPNDSHRRAISICNDVYKSTKKIVRCKFNHPIADVFVDDVKYEDVKFSVRHNDIMMNFHPIDVAIDGTSNDEIFSDTGSGKNVILHGIDLFNPNVALAIYAYLKVESKGGTVTISCKKGDTLIDGKVKYSTIVNKAKKYIDSIGGFEKFAEWGFLRPLVKD